MNADFSDYIKRLRGKRTLREVEKETGLSRSYISRIENGCRRPSADTLIKLARCYNVDYVELYGAAGFLPEEAPSEEQRARDFGTLIPLIEKLSSEQIRILLDLVQNFFINS